MSDALRMHIRMLHSYFDIVHGADVCGHTHLVVLQWVAVGCSVLQWVAVGCSGLQRSEEHTSELQSR